MNNLNKAEQILLEREQSAAEKATKSWFATIQRSTTGIPQIKEEPVRTSKYQKHENVFSFMLWHFDKLEQLIQKGNVSSEMLQLEKEVLCLDYKNNCRFTRLVEDKEIWERLEFTFKINYWKLARQKGRKVE